MLEGKSIHCLIEEQVVYGALGDNEEAIWSLLVAAGYLKILSYEKAQELKGEREPKYEVTLTNFEVKRMFSSMVRRWFYQAEAEYSDFLLALLQTVAAALAQIEEKQYEKELIARGIERKRIKKYGFAFLGKEVLIGEKE